MSEYGFDLRPHPPFRLDLTAWTLRRRGHNRLDRFDGSYHRALVVDDRAIDIRVTQSGPAKHPVLHVSLPGKQSCTSTEQSTIETQLTFLLGLDVDLEPFYELADAYPLTQAIKDRFLGVRPPRFPTMFEALVNAVANQQLSLEAGIALLNRLTETFGMPTSAGLAAFPEPEALMSASPFDLRELGFSLRKAEYIIGLAEASASGAVDADDLAGRSRADVSSALMELRGIGRWSAEYVMLRGLGRLDVFPGDDVGARNNLRRFMGLEHPPSYDEIARRLAPWGRCAGMLYFHLLLDGLVTRGDLAV